MTESVVIGIDVSKHELVVARSDTDRVVLQVANTEAGRAELREALLSGESVRVVLEASGGYERPVIRALLLAGIPVVRANARQVRDFAKAHNALAKTDVIDAVILARFGASVALRPLQIASSLREELQDLVRHRQDLLTERVRWENRQTTARSPVVRERVAARVAALQQELTEVEQAIDTLIDSWPEEAHTARLVQTMPGIGEQSARVLVAELPELGTFTRKEVAALVGVAPYNRDSGRLRGTRTIWGGRALVRTTLYMAIQALKQHNPRLAAWHERLLRAGKPAQVANIALIRKVVTILNAMVRDNRPWDPSLIEAA